MKRLNRPLRTLVNAAVVAVITSSMAHATGFSLYTEGNGYSTGNFGAGVAAEAADASTGWYNPAGLAFLHNQQVVVGGVGIFPTSALSGTSTYRTPLGGPFSASYIQSFSDMNGGQDALVPSFHYARPVGERATVGLSVVAPYGLSTNWAQDSAVRYQATFTEFLTFNISPEIGAKITDNFAVGAGLDLQHARVKFNRMLGAPALMSAVFMQDAMTADTQSYNKAESNGVGFHAGVLASFDDNHTRVGLNYQSTMRHVFHGYSRLSGPLATVGLDLADLPYTSSTAWNNSLSSNPIELPDVVTLSGYRDFNEKLAFLGSVVYTGWSSFKTIQLNNVAAPIIPAGSTVISSIGSVNSAVAQNFKDSWRFALGANYRFNPKFMLRVGGGYDQTPTNDIDRDIRLPDASRWALSIGGHYDMRENLGLDLGYTHLFPADTPTVVRTDPIGTSTYAINASGNAHAELLGAQLTWLIDAPAPVATK